MQYQLVLMAPKKTDLEIPGSIDRESPWQKKGLAYPINKKEEGYLKTVFLRLPAQKAPKVIKKLENSSQVWRFLLTKASEQDLEKNQRAWQKKPGSPEDQKEAQVELDSLDEEVVKKKSTKSKKQKVKIKDLDEKIDEILGD